MDSLFQYFSKFNPISNEDPEQENEMSNEISVFIYIDSLKIGTYNSN